MDIRVESCRRKMVELGVYREVVKMATVELGNTMFCIEQSRERLLRMKCQRGTTKAGRGPRQTKKGKKKKKKRVLKEKGNGTIRQFRLN
jgi:hypothetical protein